MESLIEFEIGRWLALHPGTQRSDMVSWVARDPAYAHWFFCNQDIVEGMRFLILAWVFGLTVWITFQIFRNWT